MRQPMNGASLHRFSMLAVSVGVLLIFTALIGSLTVIISLSSGTIAVRTFEDVRVTVFRLAYYSILPLAGGILLVLAGTTLMNRSLGTIHRSHEAGARQAVERQRSRMLNTMLSVDERRMLDLVKDSRSGVLQSNLVIQSGFSKVKTHRLLKKLESMELIRRGRAGITNRVFANSGSS